MATAAIEPGMPLLSATSLNLGGALSGQGRVIAICKELGTQTYFNSIGGLDLYNIGALKDAGIEIKFLEMESIRYRQFGDKFVPTLSIIDTLMFVGAAGIRPLLKRYRLR